MLQEALISFYFMLQVRMALEHKQPKLPRQLNARTMPAATQLA